MDETGFDRERSRAQDALEPVRDHAAVRQPGRDRDQPGGALRPAVESKVACAGWAIAERMARHEPAVELICGRSRRGHARVVERRGWGRVTARWAGVEAEQGGKPGSLSGSGS